MCLPSLVYYMPQLIAYDSIGIQLKCDFVLFPVKRISDKNMKGCFYEYEYFPGPPRGQ